MNKCALCYEEIEKGDVIIETLLHGSVHWECWNDE